MSANLIRRIARGPLKGRLCVIAHEDTRTSLLYARVAEKIGDPAPGQYDFKVQPQPFIASWLQPI